MHDLQHKSLIGLEPWEGRLITGDDPLWIANKEKFAEHLVGGKLGTPEQLANIIVYLLSNQASYITGTVYPGDFGLTAK